MRNKVDMPCASGWGQPLDRNTVELEMTRCIRRFYAAVLKDRQLQPLVEASIPDLESHIELVIRYWNCVVAGPSPGEGDYLPHVALPTDPRYLKRWHGLFVRTAFEQLPISLAALVIARAERLVEDAGAGRYAFDLRQAHVVLH